MHDDATDETLRRTMSLTMLDASPHIVNDMVQDPTDIGNDVAGVGRRHAYTPNDVVDDVELSAEAPAGEAPAADDADNNSPAAE